MAGSFMQSPFTRRGALTALMGAAGAAALPRLGLAAGTAEKSAGAPVAVHILNTSGNTSRIFGELMKRKRFLEDAGVAPRFTAISDGAKVLGALLSGDADICVGSGFAQVLPAIEKGGKVRVVAGASQLAQVAVYSSRPEIKSVKDLAGRSIGTGAPGSLLHQLMVALMVKKGVPVDGVKFMNIGSNSDVFRAVAAGTVDAGPGDFDLYDQQAKFGVHALSDGDLWTELPEFTSQATFASMDAIAAKREGLVRVLLAYSRLYRFIQDPSSRQDFRDAFAAVIKNGDAAAADTRWGFYQKYKPLATDLVISPERVKYMQELNLRLGKQSKVLPFAEVVDNSLAEEAVKRVS
jgi:ABC-type nitrate/sulfonate/bicarbonate transport system substrate-binding protein